MRKNNKKLRSQTGETIAEVLIALLISSLALVMLAGMISATNNMVNTSKEKMDSYYTANENLEKKAGSGTSDNVVITVSGGGSGINVPVNRYTNSEFGSNSVNAYYK